MSASHMLPSTTAGLEGTNFIDSVCDACAGADVVATDDSNHLPISDPPEDAYDHLPRSTSSAMPEPSSASVPRLTARVHARLPADECARIPLSALNFRPLRQEDLGELVALHTEWFPVSYDDAFYQSAVRGEIFTMVASYSRGGSTSSSLPTRPGAPAATGETQETGDQAVGELGDDEDILGIITMSTFCEHHSEDIVHILGADCATLCRQQQQQSATASPIRSVDEELEDGTIGSHSGRLAYILTLGVAEGFRRRGLGRELLNQLIRHVDANMPQIRALYLHVVTYNEAAIQLYESMRFSSIAQFNAFYTLHGKLYDSYLYALYMHGSKPPWKWRLRNFFGMGFKTLSWSEWVMSAVSSLRMGSSSSSSSTSYVEDKEDPGRVDGTLP